MRLQKQPKARSSALAEPDTKASAPKETLEVRVGTNQIANYFAAKDIFARGDGCISGHATNVKRWRSARGDQAPADQMPPKPAEKKEEEEKSYTGGTHRSSEQSTGTHQNSSSTPGRGPAPPPAGVSLSRTYPISVGEATVQLPG